MFNKRSFLLFCIAIVLFLGQLLAQNNNLKATVGYFYTGYCSIDETMSRFGYPKSDEYIDIVRKQMARYTSDKLAEYKGAEIVGLRICFGADCSKITAFLKQSLVGPDVVSKEVSVKKGWNEIFFDTPYEVTDKDIVYGFSYAQRDAAKGDPFIIACDKKDPNYQPTDGYYSSTGDEKPYSQVVDHGVLKVQLIMKGDNASFYNQFDISSLKTSMVKDSHGNITASLDFFNLGSNQVNKVELFFFGDQSKIYSKEFDLSLDPLEKKKLVCPNIPIGNAKKLLVKVNRLNGERMAGKILSVDLSDLLDHAYERQVLIETFSTESCSACPKADKAIEGLIETDKYKGKFIYMVHHTGYKDDKFTLPESKSLLCLYGINDDENASVYAPAFSLDRRRSDLENLEDRDKYPAHATHHGKSIFDQFFDEALGYPAMIKLDVVEKFDISSGNLDIEVTGESLDRLYGKDVRMNIYIVEDNIYSYDQNGTGKDPSSPTGKKLYVNMGVIRKFVTPYDGESYKIPSDGKVSFKKSVTLNKNWNAANIRIIAFASKPLYDINNCDVYNSAQTIVKEVESIGHVSDSKHYVSVLNGQIIANTGCEVVRLFTMDGKCIANHQLDSGVYIAQVSTPYGIVTVKVLIN